MRPRPAATIGFVLIGVAFLVVIVSALTTPARHLQLIRNLDHQGVARVVFDDDGTVVTTISVDGIARTWRVSDGSALESRSHADTIDVGSVLAVGSSDGSLDAYPSFGGIVELRSNPANVILRELLPENWLANLVSGDPFVPAEVYSLNFSPDATALAAGYTDGTIRLWHLADGRLRGTVHAHRATVEDIAFSPDGLILASAGQDGVRLWAVR